MALSQTDSVGREDQTSLNGGGEGGGGGRGQTDRVIGKENLTQLGIEEAGGDPCLNSDATFPMSLFRIRTS
jgi:hypothetical protein